MVMNRLDANALGHVCLVKLPVNEYKDDHPSIQCLIQNHMLALEKKLKMSV